MSDRRRKRLTPLGDLLEGILTDSLPFDRGLRSRLAAEAFLRLAGPAVASHCHVLGLEGDELRVAVSSPRWQRELRRMGGDYLRRVNRELPAAFSLSAIRFLARHSTGNP